MLRDLISDWSPTYEVCAQALELSSKPTHFFTGKSIKPLSFNFELIDHCCYYLCVWKVENCKYFMIIAEITLEINKLSRN